MILKGSVIVAPNTKPRMTRADKYPPFRKCVAKYFAYCNELCLKMPPIDFDAGKVDVIFYLEMPKSWSKKKKAHMNGRWKRTVPDSDNHLKGFVDALIKDDSGVYDMRSRKRWTDKPGYIEFLIASAIDEVNTERIL
jgi:Holliday junction resolvase RusA-like endonuclease